MNDHARRSKPTAWGQWVVATIFVTGLLGGSQAFAQVPARFYWKTLSGGNAVPLIVNSISGNTNPFDPGLTPTPDADIDATLAITGYAHTFTLFDRSAMAAILLPMGRVSGDVTVAGTTFNQSASGFGDPIGNGTLFYVELIESASPLPFSILNFIDDPMKVEQFRRDLDNYASQEENNLTVSYSSTTGNQGKMKVGVGTLMACGPDRCYTATLQSLDAWHGPGWFMEHYGK